MLLLVLLKQMEQHRLTSDLVRSYKMTIRYEIIDTPSQNQVVNAYLEDGRILSIPMDLTNSDYQAYLKSLEDEA